MTTTNQQKLLALAINIASEGHLDVLDKGGYAYILHPMQVMYNLNSDDPELMQIAILHDVIEDCLEMLIYKYHSLSFDSETALSLTRELIKSSSNEEAIELALKYLNKIGFSTRVTNGLVLMTKKEEDVGEEGYFNYVRRMFDNIDAIRVKIADLRHNTDILRMKGLSDKDFSRNRKYSIAFTMLTDRLKELCVTGCIGVR